MQIIAKGKEDVLAYLEHAAMSRAGKPGEYSLQRDDSGNLVAFIAGHSFTGTGAITLDGNRLVAVDGILVHFTQP